MHVQVAFIVGLLSSSALAYGTEDWGNKAPRPKTITKVIHRDFTKTKTCTVTKTKCITKTKTQTEIQRVTVTAIPAKNEKEETVDSDVEPDMEGDDPPPQKVEDVEAKKKPAKTENQDEEEEKPVEDPEKIDDENADEPKRELGVDEEEPAGDEPKSATMTYNILATTKNNKPVFDPPSLIAPTGSTINFIFHPMNHSVVRGSFDKPCVPLEEGGFFSGFFPVKSISNDNPTFSIKVEDNNPIWFYCSAGKHCQAGMVGVINPESDDDVKTYASAAAKVIQNISPKKVGGGVEKRKRSFYRY